MRKPQLEIMERSAVERLARIIGPHSAAALALASADRRVAAVGGSVVFATDRANGKLVVLGFDGPAAEAEEGEGAR